MGGEWQKCEWGDIATLEYGKALRDYRSESGAYRVYGTNGPIGWYDEPLCEHPGVVVGRKGAYRGIHYSPEPFFVIDTAFYLKPKRELDLRWAYYCLLTYDINGMDSGSAIPSTSREAFYRLPVRVPPVKEQRAIACILGSLDDKIELNRRMNRTLEEMARAIFKSWFIDFDPVRAKAQVRREHPKWTDDQVSRAACPKLKPEIARLFPDSFEDSELGEIPKGWRVGSFGDVVKHLRNLENPLLSPDVLFRHFSIPAFDDGQSPKVECGDSIRSTKFQVPQNAILLSKLNPEVPRVWMVDVQPGDRAVCSTEFLVLSAVSPFTRSFVYCLALSPLFRQQIEGLVTGTSKSHQRAEVSSILKAAVILPPEPVVQAFAHMADSLLARTLECRRESRTLAALRDALLPKLISGQLRVPDAERIVQRKV